MANDGRPFDFAVLRGLRKREGLTIGEVSARSGISPAVISKLERNQTHAELETVFRLARVFGLTAADLLSLVERRAAHKVTGSGYRSDGFTFRTVTYGNARLFHGVAAKGACTHRPEIHHDDYEICWVLEGAVEVTLPREKHVLKDGTALQFDAVLEHTYRALAPSRLVIAHITKAKRF
mgnify:CR=1 FL=1